MKLSVLSILVLIFIACSKDVKEQEVTYDQYGNQTHECSIRDAKGYGPYEPLGRVSDRECKSLISKLCNKKKYKQVHKHKGHFARGKFKDKIMIGTCP